VRAGRSLQRRLCRSGFDGAVTRFAHHRSTIVDSLQTTRVARIGTAANAEPPAAMACAPLLKSLRRVIRGMADPSEHSQNAVGISTINLADNRRPLLARIRPCREC
jgi:hypothetical protein